ncbi:MAG: HTH-type transcriptional repressor AseR [bacterium ADurb.Bin429]|nr:MAG: HTH-type transcriptional repressor AseR [bacterium ADurb.Bin429]
MAHITFTETVTIHQALSDPLRILIMRLLMERELCVCELVRALEEPQYKVSRHLAVLKNAGLVRDWREGTWMHYELAPTLPETWMAALRALMAVWDTQTEIQATLWRLHQRADRKPGEAVGCCKE